MGGAGHPRVLVVEDDALMRRILTRAFARLEVDAVIVADRLAARSALEGDDRAGSFGLGFVDLHLAGERGSDVVHELRPLGPAPMRWVCISGAVDLPGSAMPPFDGVERKPATVAELQAMLERWSPSS